MENNDIIPGEVALKPLEINFKYTPHIVLLTIIFLLQFTTRQKEAKINNEIYTEEHKSEGRKIMYRYVIITQLAKAADWIISPFIFEFIRTRQFINFEKVGILIAISFLSNIFLGPLLVGYLIDKSNKKFACILFCVIMTLSCIFRFIKNPMSMVFSQITYGVATSLLNSAFENWLICELKVKFTHDRIREIILGYILEKVCVWDSMMCIFITATSGIIINNLGINYPFFISIGLCILCLLLCILLIPDLALSSSVVEEELYDISDVYKNLKCGFNSIVKKPFLISIGLTESLLFASLHIFSFTWNSALTRLTLDGFSSDPFTLFMISTIVGGTAFRTLFLHNENNVMKFVKISSFISMFSYFFVNFFPVYKLTLFAFFMYQGSIGLFFPSYCMIKSEFLPNEQRGTISNIFRIPFYLINLILMVYMPVLHLDQLLLINFFITTICFILHFLTFYEDKKEALKRTLFYEENDVNKINKRMEMQRREKIRQYEENRIIKEKYS